MMETGIDEVAMGQWIAWAEQIAERQDPFVAGFLEESLQTK
jgi:hypothetical protein